MYDIMLKPIARIFYRGEVVAYRLQDNTGKIVDYNPQEFYIAAKDGIVVNCKASGGVVSGINGFELKKLQTIKQQDRRSIYSGLFIKMRRSSRSHLWFISL